MIRLCLLLISAATVPKNTYFFTWKKQLTPYLTIEKTLNSPLVLSVKNKLLPCKSYTCIQNTFYAFTDSGLFKASVNGFEKFSKNEEIALFKPLTWVRKFNFYHGFPSLITVVLCIPSLLLLLFPALLAFSNMLFGSKEKPMFFVNWRWRWISLIILGWCIEIFLRMYPNSF